MEPSTLLSIAVGGFVVWKISRMLIGKISPEKARALVEGGARLVDVRSPGEHAAGHIDGSINVPVQDREPDERARGEEQADHRVLRQRHALGQCGGDAAAGGLHRRARSRCDGSLGMTTQGRVTTCRDQPPTHELCYSVIMSASEKLIETIRDSIIGDDQRSRRHLRPAPRDLRRLHRVGPLAHVHRGLHPRRGDAALREHAHRDVSGTGRQTTRFREDAREIIHAPSAAAPDDVVIFCGSGATGAINKLIDILNLRLPADLDARYELCERRSPRTSGRSCSSARSSTTRTSCRGASRSPTSSTIHEDADGHVDLAHLERELVAYAARPLKIGSFSAASNVTGIATDTRRDRRRCSTSTARSRSGTSPRRART